MNTVNTVHLIKMNLYFLCIGPGYKMIGHDRHYTIHLYHIQQVSQVSRPLLHLLLHLSTLQKSPGDSTVHHLPPLLQCLVNPMNLSS